MKDDAASGLNERQRKFAELYAATGNASKAAIGAGYSPKSAPTNADKLLKNTNVQAYIRQLTRLAQAGRVATAEERQAFWTDVMFGRIQDDEGRAPRIADRLKASELLGKSQGDFIDRVEHSGDLGVIGIEVIPPK